MGSLLLDATPDTKGLCGLCWVSPSREDCHLAVEGEQRPICRCCWEQAMLDPRRVARRVKSSSPGTRFLPA